jgi:hypothetical protein
MSVSLFLSVPILPQMEHRVNPPSLAPMQGALCNSAMARSASLARCLLRAIAHAQQKGATAACNTTTPQPATNRARGASLARLLQRASAVPWCNAQRGAVQRSKCNAQREAGKKPAARRPVARPLPFWVPSTCPYVLVRRRAYFPPIYPTCVEPYHLRSPLDAPRSPRYSSGVVALDRAAVGCAPCPSRGSNGLRNQRT